MKFIIITSFILFIIIIIVPVFMYQDTPNNHEYLIDHKIVDNGEVIDYKYQGHKVFVIYHDSSDFTSHLLVYDTGDEEINSIQITASTQSRLKIYSNTITVYEFTDFEIFIQFYSWDLGMINQYNYSFGPSEGNIINIHATFTYNEFYFNFIPSNSSLIHLYRINTVNNSLQLFHHHLLIYTVFQNNLYDQSLLFTRAATGDLLIFSEKNDSLDQINHRPLEYDNVINAYYHTPIGILYLQNSTSIIMLKPIYSSIYIDFYIIKETELVEFDGLLTHYNISLNKTSRFAAASIEVVQSISRFSLYLHSGVNSTYNITPKYSGSYLTSYFLSLSNLKDDYIILTMIRSSLSSFEILQVSIRLESELSILYPTALDRSARFTSKYMQHLGQISVFSLIFIAIIINFLYIVNKYYILYHIGRYTTYLINDKHDLGVFLIKFIGFSKTIPFLQDFVSFITKQFHSTFRNELFNLDKTCRSD